MSASKQLLFTHTSRKRSVGVRSFSQKSGDTNKNPRRVSRLTIPQFDAENEHLFWQERQSESLTTLNAALALGATGFLAFIVLDIIYGRLSVIDLINRSFIVLVLFLLLVYLHRHMNPGSQIHAVAKLGVSFSLIALISMLQIEGNPEYYAETWVGLLPIYFFTYGQMFLTIKETVSFGIIAMVALPLSGYMIGVSTTDLMPSVMILQIVNLFGFCTRRQLEADARNLFKERRKAECASENKTEFLRHLSHNLRQPLQALSCYSSILDAAYADNASGSMKPIVGKMGCAIDELSNAFNHILDIANLESGQQIPFLSSVDINVVLAALEDQFAPQAEKRGLKLKVKLRSKPPFSVFSDASILTQVIANLIDNAIKYTAKGSVLVRTVSIGSHRLKINVCDTGIGITEQQRHHVFKEFYRGHRRSEDQHIDGMGIGLSYVGKAVEHLPEHAIMLHSKPQHGSKFCLTLPVAVESVKRAQLLEYCNRSPAGSFVFVVDDNQQLLSALVEQLTGWGCLVQAAASKAEVLAALIENARPPDLLITDFYLEDNETAHDIISAIEADCGPVPTIILSAHTIPDADKARFSENTLLLRKPAGAAVLMEMMTKAMGK